MLFVLTGPESSAKSELTCALGDYFQMPTVAEVARDYLQSQRHYLPSDLLEIARRQTRAEQRLAQKFAFADTDLQVIHIWWQERFGPAPLELSKAYAEQSERFYLLCEPDIPWTPDPLRQNPNDRDRLYGLYMADLQRRNLPFACISGLGSARLQRAIAAVKLVLGT